METTILIVLGLMALAYIIYRLFGPHKSDCDDCASKDCPSDCASCSLYQASEHLGEKKEEAEKSPTPGAAQSKDPADPPAEKDSGLDDSKKKDRSDFIRKVKRP